MSDNPFLAFSWHRPFLPDLKRHIEEQTGGFCGSAVVIVPNQRPWRYFADLFARDKKPGLLPKMLAFSEVVEIWNASSGCAPGVPANQLDQVFLLYECLKRISADDQCLAAKFSRMDIAAFLPWGIRLADLLEEFFVHGVDPRDISHAGGEVDGLAAALLSALGRINGAWRETLVSKERSTPGLEQYLAQKNCDQIPPLFQPQADKPVFIAGFAVLNGAENRVLRALWQAGAKVCLHTDPNLVKGKNFHWSCEGHSRWLKLWNAKIVEPDENCSQSGTEAVKTFFAGYDSHSQLRELQRKLKQDGGKKDQSAAIILPSPDLLMPVLHHLPDKDVNISMGYPLTRSTLNMLLEDVFALLGRRTIDGLYYWSDLLKVINQPFLKMLGGDSAPDVRKALHLLDDKIRKGERYVSLATLKTAVKAAINGAAGDIVEECFKILIDDLGSVKTPGQFAEALEAICDFLTRSGGNIWESFPLDAEAMGRMKRSVIPVLRENALADHAFSLPVLEGIFRVLLDKERIAFEADPLTGVQVLGMLETRLLHFDRLFILDASDDLLPGRPAQDPLLPDPLRKFAGLPNSHTRTQTTAYNLFRLLASAKEVNFFWQEGVSPSALADGKKYRSRFVEQLIWAEEQKAGKIFKRGDGPIAWARAFARMENRSPRPIARSETLNARLAELLGNRISATMIDSYLRCPIAFACEKLLDIREIDEVNEGEDPALVGKCIHRTLFNIYEPFLNREFKKSEISADWVDECFRSAMTEMNVLSELPAGSCLALEISGPRRLRDYLSEQPDIVIPRALEHEIETDLTLCGKKYRFKGSLDRLDERDGYLFVLDYKTGRLKTSPPDLWRNDEFFKKLRDYCLKNEKFDAEGETMFQELRENLTSVQLPLYLALLSERNMGKIANAAYVDLRDACREVSLFEIDDPEEIGAAIENCRIAVAFILRHMESSAYFAAANAKVCGRLPYCAACRVQANK